MSGPAADLPDGILDRARQLTELHRRYPTVEMVEAAQLMAQMLHIAVHGETWARPESPQEVWLGLLGEVVRMRQSAADVRAFAARLAASPMFTDRSAAGSVLAMLNGPSGSCPDREAAEKAL